MTNEPEDEIAIPFDETAAEREEERRREDYVDESDRDYETL